MESDVGSSRDLADFQDIFVYTYVKLKMSLNNLAPLEKGRHCQ